jgi:histidinol-phosphatase (PHP family)
VECAIAKGLAGLTFTEHFDTQPDDWEGCVYDDEAYAATIEQLRTRFGRTICIGKGIEICYQPDRMGFILDFLGSHEFDLVVLSVHYFGHRAVYVRESWDGVDVVEGARRYFETVLEAARFCERLHRTQVRVFDVLGHLDLVKRYTHRFFETHEMSPFVGLMDEILQACLAADLIPELNTSSLRQDLPEPMPGANAIARYAQLGGKAMSLGSDAHRPEDVGADFNRAAAILRTAGLTHHAVFENRKKRLIPFD